MNEPMIKTGLLLLNMGTPSDPSSAAVRRYLRELLSDRRIIDLCYVCRKVLLESLILPFRVRRSARRYGQMFDPERGFPLRYYAQQVEKGLREFFACTHVEVALAMRYGSPSIDGSLDYLMKKGTGRLVVFPLYPHYASASTGSSVSSVMMRMVSKALVPPLCVVPPFFSSEIFLAAIGARAIPVLSKTKPQKVIFSYHGIPAKDLHFEHLRSGRCKQSSRCCEKLGEDNQHCYRAQCFATTRLLGDRLGIDPVDRVTCFQSRFGSGKWIGPAIDEVLHDLLDRGTRRIAVLTPSFVADCLETLVEIGIEARELWHREGGSDFVVVPCLNDSPFFVEALARLAAEASPWIGNIDGLLLSRSVDGNADSGPGSGHEDDWMAKG